MRGLLGGLSPRIKALVADVPSAHDAGADLSTLVDGALDAGAPPDAIVAYNDMHAVGILSALRARGIEPGRDVAVASFDNVPEAAQHFPGLTSADGFPTRVGTVATELVLHAYENGDAPGRARVDAGHARCGCAS